MMEAVKRGGSRQALHEILRKHSHAAAYRVKEEDGVNDLLERIANDPAVPLTMEEICAHLIPEQYVGRAPEQTAEFLAETIGPVLARYPDEGRQAELKV